MQQTAIYDTQYHFDNMSPVLWRVSSSTILVPLSKALNLFLFQCNYTVTAEDFHFQLYNLCV